MNVDGFIQEGQGHPIQVVSRRTGLTPDVIRVWERRYGAVSPRRSTTNRRLYSDDDVERLLLLRRATLCGRRIGDVASVETTRLRQLVAEDESAALRAEPFAARSSVLPAPTDSDAHFRHCLDAIEKLDCQRLERELSTAAVTLSVPALLDRLIAPLLEHVGRGWREGTLRVAHEHMLTGIVRSFLASTAQGAGGDRSAGPDLVVTTPSGQSHELGALMAAVTASLEGWRVTYLGPDLPAEEIAAAARMRGARLVSLSIVYPADDPRLAGELRKLGRLLPEDAMLVAGGAAAPAYQAVLVEIGAKLVGDLGGLRSVLEDIRYDPARGASKNSRQASSSRTMR